MNALLEAALRYAEHGYSVIPLHTPTKTGCTCGKTTCKKPGKHPRLATWTALQKTPATEEQIREWWKTWPSANVGIITGKVSGIVVMDVDGQAGRDTIADRPLPDGPLSITGSGGQHRLYWHPGGDLRNFARKLPGLDARGDGGLVVAPPSLHESGKRYEWRVAPWEQDAPEMPEWFAAQFTAAATTTTAPSTRSAPENEVPAWLKAMLFGAEEGGRNDALTRVAGHYAALGIGSDDLIPILEAVNARFASPLELDEVEQVARSIIRSEQRKAATRDPEALTKLESAGVPEQDIQAARLENLSNALGVTVQRVIKYEADPPKYLLQVNGRRVPLGQVDGLLQWGNLRKAIAAGTGRLIPGFSKKEWPKVAQLLLDACEHLEVEEATILGALRRWITDYLNQWESTVEEACEKWADAALESRPFITKGHLWVTLAHLHSHIKTRLAETITAGELATQLRQCGAEPSLVKATGSQKSAPVRAWRLPEALVNVPAWADQVTAGNGR